MPAQYLGNVRHLNSLELAPPGISMRYNKKMPKNDTLDALEEHKEHEDDYQTNSN